MPPRPGPRLGLCCTFLEQPIRFRTTTARFAATLAARERRKHLHGIALDNAAALVRAVEWCAANGVGAFRVTSKLLPLSTHRELGYGLADIDRDGAVETILRQAGRLAARQGVRLSFHPDQFVVPGSAREEVVRSSIAEIEAQALLAEKIGAEQLTLHGGGAQGGKRAALERLARGLGRLSARARSRVALENDDRVYTVRDLLPLCRREGVPLVYDVHHHRCNPDGLCEEEATDGAAETWGRREPWAHLSSPRQGWTAPDPRFHADYIDPRDVPAAWRARRMTIDVEAKAKERAVLALKRARAPGGCGKPPAGSSLSLRLRPGVGRRGCGSGGGGSRG
ncbi:MAG TPA: UV DNA damage repair endonuclease UvsE [Myxococcales bacterium]|nr:UV DNA damage repair endonuclease UvsE [Myxococcales bacterium]